MRKITYTMLYRPCWDSIAYEYCLVNIVQIRVWDNIAHDNYLCNVNPERTNILSQENRLFQICLVACFLNRVNITEQSWLFLLNVDSGVHLRLARQQWTRTDIDWNRFIKQISTFSKFYDKTLSWLLSWHRKTLPLRGLISRPNERA